MRFYPKHPRACALALALFLLGCADKDPESPNEEQSTGSSAPGQTSSNPSSDPSSDADNTGPQDTTKDLPNPATPPTWENFGDAFLRNWCKGCHSPHLQGEARFGAPEGVDLFSLEELRQWEARVRARATGKAPTMPPAGGPSQEERDRLAQWLSLGAPEQADLQKE